MRQEIKAFNAQYETSLQIRTGIATGPIMAGVIGRKKFAYDIWGDTVNIANQLVSTSEPGCVHVAESTFLHVSARKHLDEFPLHLHSTVAIKGLRKMLTYQLL
jgi:class 3 adenylate cyclase